MSTQAAPVHHPYQPKIPELLIRVRALRGVCIGVNRNMAPGDTADLEPAQAVALVHTGAVVRVDEGR